METVKNKKTELHIIAKNLLKEKVQSIDGVKMFIVGVNNLAYEILENEDFQKELRDGVYADNELFLTSVNYILAYGRKAKDNAQLFPREQIKEINLNNFLKKYPDSVYESQIATEKSELLFKFLGRENETFHNLFKMVEEIHEMLKSFLKTYKHRASMKKKYQKFDNIPKDFEWDKVEIKITTDSDGAEICYGGKIIEKGDYIKLGFSSNLKNHKKNREWRLLVALSIFNDGKIERATPNTLIGMMKGVNGRNMSLDSIYQAKRHLSEALCSMFGTNKDPFVDISDKSGKDKYYEPIFKIKPEPLMREEELYSATSSLANYTGVIEDGYNEDETFKIEELEDN